MTTNRRLLRLFFPHPFCESCVLVVLNCGVIHHKPEIPAGKKILKYFSGFSHIVYCSKVSV